MTSDSIAFSLDGFEEALAAGDITPAGAFAPFIRIIPEKFRKPKGNGGENPWEKLQERIGEDSIYHNSLVISQSYASRNASLYFPSFRLFSNEFLNDDWLASVDWRKFHRDHALHNSLTAYVAMKLLEQKWASTGRKLIDLCVDQVMRDQNHWALSYLEKMRANPRFYTLPRGGGSSASDDNALPEQAFRMVWRELIRETVFVAALFHDIGYPWQFSEFIRSPLKEQIPGGDPAQALAQWIVERYHERLVFYPFTGYRPPKIPGRPANWPEELVKLVRKCMEKSHGLPGALAFLYLNDAVRAFPEQGTPAERRFCLEWAALAILMHDMPGIYSDAAKSNGRWALNVQHPQMRLHFHVDPVSCVVTLADQIQDFCRPDAKFNLFSASNNIPEIFRAQNDGYWWRMPKDNGAGGDAHGILQPATEKPRSSRPVFAQYRPRCKWVEIRFDSGDLFIRYYYSRHGDCIRNHCCPVKDAKREGLNQPFVL